MVPVVRGKADGVNLVVDALARHVESGAVSGLVAVLACGAQVEVIVLGDSTVGGKAMAEDSLFRIASAGKPITAAAVLTLVADGLVGLDDPIDDVIPELAAPRVLRELAGPIDDTVVAARPITLRDLLRSTNGHGFPSDFTAPVVAVLMDGLRQGPPEPQSVPGPERWMAILQTIPLLHQPGEGFTYNTAYDILGVFVSRASGRPFPDYLHERILAPLAMNDTGFCFPPGSLDRATTYYRHGEEDALVAIDPPDGQWATPPAFASGAGGYVSSAGDLLCFQRMLLAGGGDVLPRALVDAMMRDQLTAAIRATDTAFLDGQSWGYGGGVDIAISNPWNVMGRYGWVGGTGTSAHVVPSDNTIAILLTQTELGGPTGSAILESFWTAAASARSGRTIPGRWHA